ncbi:MAG: glucosaminidase domain-containing protein [Gammaproteobacteria bacterium]|nr:glucosaminidase domain-containing protein [Gammaproteobacteria bacterium]
MYKTNPDIEGVKAGIATPMLMLAALSVGSLIVVFAITLLTFPAEPASANLSGGLDLELEPISLFPDFSSIQDVESKKQRFFDYLEGFVVAENKAIAASRTELLPYAEIVSKGYPLSEQERQWVDQLANIYRIDTSGLEGAEIVAELLLRVDIIPVSLVLAQAANESAWGTSRFVLEGNNIFGEWCFEPGCGMVPLHRHPGDNHEVQHFDSIDQSIESYFLNINTHRSYRYLRDLRAEIRVEGGEPDPMLLATGLRRYSQRGDDYVDEVQTIILQNDLIDRDRG